MLPFLRVLEGMQKIEDIGPWPQVPSNMVEDTKQTHRLIEATIYLFN